jgi:hypothetical protein
MTKKQMVELSTNIVHAKLQIRTRDQKTELTGRSPLSRQKFALDSSAIKGLFCTCL